MLLSVKNKQQIVVVSSPPFMMLFIPILFGKKFRNLVLDIRDLYPDVLFDSGLFKANSYFGKLLKRVERMAYDSSSSIVTVCDSLFNKISKRTKNKNIVVVHNGYSGIFSKAFDSAKFSSSDLIVVCHGNFGRFQNVDFLIDLSKFCEIKAPRLKFKFIGFGSKFEYLKQKASKNCLFMDAISQKDLVKELKLAHFGISARTDDFIGVSAMPVKVLEFLGAGLPVISLPKLDDMQDFESECNLFQFEYQDSVANVTKFFEKIISGEFELKDKNSYCFLRKYDRTNLAKKFCDTVKLL